MSTTTVLDHPQERRDLRDLPDAIVATSRLLSRAETVRCNGEELLTPLETESLLRLIEGAALRLSAARDVLTEAPTASS